MPNSIEANMYTVELVHSETDGDGNTTDVTDLVNVLCATLERSIELAKEQFTGATIKSVRNNGDQTLVVDPQLLA